MTTQDQSKEIKPLDQTPAHTSEVFGEGMRKPLRLDASGVETHMSMMVGNAPDPFVSKLNDGHITTMIQNDGDEMKRAHTRYIVKVVSLMGLGVVTLGFVVLLCYLFADKHPALVEKVLVGVVGFLGGVGAGVAGHKLLGPKDGD